MKVILSENNQYILRFVKDEELMEGIKKFCDKEGIQSAFFHGLGACSYLNLAAYNLNKTQYNAKEFNESLEIANLVGNVALIDNETFVHMHGTFSRHDLNAIAGHVLKVVISATCEIQLTKFDLKMERVHDENIGLKLLESCK